MENPQIILRQTIDVQLYQKIKELETICLQNEEVDSYKLELDYKLKNSMSHENNQKINEFLYFINNNLIGYLGICDFDNEVLEATGMVHPNFRNQGIFTQLYNLVQAEFNKRPAKELLFICPKDSNTGIQFIEKKQAAYHHAEYDMYLNSHLFVPMNNYHLELKEIDTQKHLFNGRIGDTVVGQVRIEVVGELGGIYGLEIYPSFRRQGYGRELLMQTIEKLLTLGIKNVFLQVDTINENALSLYQSCGFIEKNVMNYYSISKK